MSVCVVINEPEIVGKDIDITLYMLHGIRDILVGEFDLQFFFLLRLLVGHSHSLRMRKVFDRQPVLQPRGRIMPAILQVCFT